MNTISDVPKRHPRLYTGDAAAALASLLRSDSVFKVKLPPDKMSVVFSYEFSVPDGIPPQFLELYEVLFAGGRKHWKRALLVATKESQERKKRALGRVHNFYQGILTDSFKAWLFESWGLGSVHLRLRKEQLETFQKGATLTSGIKPDARTAFVAAIRFRELDEVFKNMLHRLKAKSSQPIKKEVQVKAEIMRSKLSQELISRALNSIYGAGRGITFMELFTPGLRHGQIARAVVRCELKDRGCNLDLISSDTYIDYGTRLLELLDALNKRQ